MKWASRAIDSGERAKDGINRQLRIIKSGRENLPVFMVSAALESAYFAVIMLHGTDHISEDLDEAMGHISEGCKTLRKWLQKR